MRNDSATKGYTNPNNYEEYFNVSQTSQISEEEYLESKYQERKDIRTQEVNALIILYSLFDMICTFIYFALFLSIIFLFNNQLTDPNNLLVFLSVGGFFLDAIVIALSQGITTMSNTNIVFVFSAIILLLNIASVTLQFLVLFSCLIKKDDIHIFSIEICGSLLKKIVLFIPKGFSIFFTIMIFISAYQKKQHLKVLYMEYLREGEESKKDK